MAELDEMIDGGFASRATRNEQISEGDRFRYKFLGGYLLLQSTLIILRAIFEGGAIWLALLFALIQLGLALFLILQRPFALTLLKYYALVLFVSFLVYLTDSPAETSLTGSYLSLAQNLGLLLLSVKPINRILALLCYTGLAVVIGIRIYQYL